VGARDEGGCNRSPDAALVRQRGRRPFANDRRLSAGEIATLSAWADGGAVEGDEKDRPAPVTFVDGWSITPEMIIEMPQDVPVPRPEPSTTRTFS
jgi:hypothetical protein